MTVFTIHEAKTNLSKLLAAVESGGEVVIARGDKPIAKLVPIEPVKKQRSPGRLEGLVALDDSFFDPLPEEELALWNGEGD